MDDYKVDWSKPLQTKGIIYKVRVVGDVIYKEANVLPRKIVIRMDNKGNDIGDPWICSGDGTPLLDGGFIIINSPPEKKEVKAWALVHKKNNHYYIYRDEANAEWHLSDDYLIVELSGTYEV